MCFFKKKKKRLTEAISHISHYPDGKYCFLFGAKENDGERFPGPDLGWGNTQRGACYRAPGMEAGHMPRLAAKVALKVA